MNTSLRLDFGGLRSQIKEQDPRAEGENQKNRPGLQIDPEFK